MKRSNGHSHSLNDLFKESRNPVRNSINIMEEVMRGKGSGHGEPLLSTEFNLSL